MREDMFKVIVERPRHGRFMKSEYPCPRDLEESQTTRLEKATSLSKVSQ